jgi:hypothetical protein
MKDDFIMAKRIRPQIGKRKITLMGKPIIFFISITIKPHKTERTTIAPHLIEIFQKYPAT